MTLPTTVTITNSNVNSGTAINLNSNNITTTWEAFTKAIDTPNTSVTATYDSRLGKGVTTGFKNPMHTVQGTIDLNASHISGSAARIDFEYVEELMKRGDTICVLKSNKFKTTSNSTGEKNVMLLNYNDGLPNSNIIKYTFKFIEINSGS